MPKELRDHLASAEYFDRGIGWVESIIERRRQSFAAASEAESDHKFRCLDWNVEYYLQLASAQYSRGDDAGVVAVSVGQAIDAAQQACAIAGQDREGLRTRDPLADYRVLLWLVSLAIALNVDDDRFDAVVDATVGVHGDRLVDTLIASRRPEHPIGSTLLYPRIVGLLMDAADSSVPEPVIAKYLKTWLRLWKREDTFVGKEVHIARDRDGYFGYWSFEALGVVAMLGIDDTAFREFNNYPGELLLAKGGTRRVPAASVSAAVPEAPIARPTASPVSADTLTTFPINWEVTEVIALVEELLAARGLPGRFSPINEEADEYEELGRRADGLEGHFVTIGRMNNALQPYGWSLVHIETGAVAAVPLDEVASFQSAQTAA